MHILNLAAKSIMNQFDFPKVKAGEALTHLAGDIEMEEKVIQGDFSSDNNEDDDNEGLTNIREEMLDEEIAALNESLKPVRLVLVKVSSISDWTYLL